MILNKWKSVSQHMLFAIEINVCSIYVVTPEHGTHTHTSTHKVYRNGFNCESVSNILGSNIKHTYEFNDKFDVQNSLFEFIYLCT